MITATQGRVSVPMVTPTESQVAGFIVSSLTALLMGAGVYFSLDYLWDFYGVGTVIGTFSGVIAGGISGLLMYFKNLRAIKLNWVGVGLFFGAPTKRIFAPGTHWVWPFHGLQAVPGPTEIWDLTMEEGEKIDAQDGSPIYFGLEEDGGRLNSLQYSVIDPILYIAVDDPEKELRDLYADEARTFLGQSAAAVGAKNEKTLFKDFLLLPPDLPSTDPEFIEYKERLSTVKFTRRENKPKKKSKTEPETEPETEKKQPERLYSDDAVKTIMRRAGSFRKQALTWGIGNMNPFTPNIRENPLTEAAATKKQVAIEEMEALHTKVGAITSLTSDMREKTGMSPDLAGVLVAAVEGRPVTISNQTFNYPGLAFLGDALKTVGEKAIDRFAPPPKGDEK